MHLARRATRSTNEPQPGPQPLGAAPLRPRVRCEPGPADRVASSGRSAPRPEPSPCREPRLPRCCLEFGQRNDVQAVKAHIAVVSLANVRLLLSKMPGALQATAWSTSPLVGVDKLG